LRIIVVTSVGLALALEDVRDERMGNAWCSEGGHCVEYGGAVKVWRTKKGGYAEIRGVFAGYVLWYVGWITMMTQVLVTMKVDVGDNDVKGLVQ
jgi:hypothetical protein